MIDRITFEWPPRWPEIDQAVARQLGETSSIYDRGGVFGRFEDAWAERHRRQHALLFNSGTSALLACYAALGLGPGDEVLSPVFTFPATVSPLAILGATPVFVDCEADGNLSVADLHAAMGPAVRAVVVTHMWGRPAQMDEIVAFCDEHDLPLVEDCSHAHGATFDGQPVGSFGTMAAWSLQGGKTVSGGEGGIVVCDRRDLFERALLLGHYNKRCRNELAPDSPYRSYAITGFGLKLRAHPFAIAMAECLLHRLDEIVEGRQRIALEMEGILRSSPHIRVHTGGDRLSSYYALAFNVEVPNADPKLLDDVEDELERRGLDLVDRPGSTMPLAREALFTRPEAAFASFDSAPTRVRSRTWQAAAVHRSLFKMPVWFEAADLAGARAYTEEVVAAIDAVLGPRRG